MRRLHSYVLSLVLVCLSMPAGHAQTTEQDARKTFYAYADKFANIFVGRMPESYPAGYNGSYFLESHNFTEGSLSYNGRYYSNVMLNINAHKDQLYCLFSEGGYSIVLDSDLVEDLVIGGKRFEYYAPNQQAGLAAGYYAILHEGSVRLLQHTGKKYVEESDIHFLILDKRFDTDVRYYLIKDEQAFVLTGRSRLLSILSDRRRELSRWNPPKDIKESPAEAYMSYIGYYESLIK